MSDDGDDTRFTARLLNARAELEFGSALEGCGRSEFIRRAIRDRAERLERDLATTTTEREESR